MKIYELYGFMNLGVDTENYQTNCLQRLLGEIICADDIIDKQIVILLSFEAREGNRYACVSHHVYSDSSQG